MSLLNKNNIKTINSQSFKNLCVGPTLMVLIRSGPTLTGSMSVCLNGLSEFNTQYFFIEMVRFESQEYSSPTQDSIDCS